MLPSDGTTSLRQVHRHPYVCGKIKKLSNRREEHEITILHQMAQEASDRCTDTHTHVIKKRAGRRPAFKKTRGAWDYNTFTKWQKETQTGTQTHAQKGATHVIKKRAGRRPAFKPALFLITCVSLSVYQSGASLVIRWKLLSLHASLVFVRAGLRPAPFLITRMSLSVYLSGASLVNRKRQWHLFACTTNTVIFRLLVKLRWKSNDSSTSNTYSFL